MKIPLSKPWLTDRESEAVSRAVKSGWISQGPAHECAEEILRTRCGRSYCLLTSSGTMALQVAQQAIGGSRDTRVVVPAECFAGVAQAGPGKHVMVDIDRFWQIATPEFELKVRDACVIAVDNYGGMPNYGPLESACRTHCVPLIEDAAEAYGASYSGRPAGNFGDISIFSFYANKIVTSGEGGALLTDNPIIYHRAKAIINFGRSGSSIYHDTQGTHGRMTEMQAALLVQQLSRADELINARRVRVAMYNSHLNLSDRCKPQPQREETQNAPWLYCLLVDARERDSIILALAEANIESRPFFPVLTSHRGLTVENACRHADGNGQEIAARGICLPLYPEMTEAEIEKVCEIVKRFV